MYLTLYLTLDVFIYVTYELILFDQIAYFHGLNLHVFFISIGQSF